MVDGVEMRMGRWAYSVYEQLSNINIEQCEHTKPKHTHVQFVIRIVSFDVAGDWREGWAQREREREMGFCIYV